ncbi:hypothetical protein AAGV33_07040 [Flavobacterium sp. FBOR7N2.3]|uniref:Uncharacterized protein n=1 Tax=Flavobacterium magnesitis TaxID=3138077 RepID=A0ABV4TJ92_9FLAO
MNYIKNILILLFICKFSNVQSQIDCQKLKETITIKNQQIDNLNNEVNYYKEALSLTKSVVQTEIENIKFQINSVVGNRQDKSIEVEGIYTNQGDILKALQAERATIIDPKGNLYTSVYEINLGGGSIRVENIYTNVPMKFKIFFRNIEEETPVIRVLTLAMFSKDDSGKINSGKFENINVTWK